MGLGLWASRTKTRLLRMALLLPIRRKLRFVGRLVLQSPRRFRNRKARTKLLRGLSRAFFITLLVLLLVCTAIDVLKQSFKSGQFWNSIIVIIVIAILTLYSVLLSLLRRVNSTRWLAAIPRSRQVGRSDVGSKMVRKIDTTRLWCRFLFKTQRDFAEIVHPGAQNPLRRGKSELPIEIPYWELADTVPNFLAGNVAIVAPDLRILPNQSLREYLAMLVTERAITSPAVIPQIDEFVSAYEVLRYSYDSLSYDELIRMMSALADINNHVQERELFPTSSSQSRLSFPSQETASESSVLIHPTPVTPPNQIRSHNLLSNISPRNSVYSVLSQMSNE